LDGASMNPAASRFKKGFAMAGRARARDRRSQPDVQNRTG
jgi:hypothetical protein